MATTGEHFRVEDFLHFKEVLQRGTNKEQLDTLNKIRKASSVEIDPPLDLIIKSELVPMLMKWDKEHETPEASLQDILWTLANIASGNSNETMYMVHQGGIEYFMEWSSYSSESIYSQALWGLANIAGESSKFRDFLLDKGGLRRCLDIYYKRRETMKIETKRTIAWLVNNLCRNKPSVVFQKVEEALPYLADSLKDQDHDVVVENLWACAYLTEIHEDAIRALVNKHIINQVVGHITANVERLTVVTPALKTLANVVTGSEEVTEKLLNMNIVPTVASLLTSEKPVIRREACFFFSNVVAGSQSHINFVFNMPNFLSTIVNIIQTDEASVVNEAIWIIANSLMGNTIAHAKKIIGTDAFLFIFKKLAVVSKKTQLIGLEGFRELLNHVMDMPETPNAIVPQIRYYRQHIEPIYQSLKDESFAKNLKDINCLILDILDSLQ